MISITVECRLYIYKAHILTKRIKITVIFNIKYYIDIIVIILSLMNISNNGMKLLRRLGLHFPLEFPRLKTILKAPYFRFFSYDLWCGSSYILSFLCRLLRLCKHCALLPYAYILQIRRCFADYISFKKKKF